MLRRFTFFAFAFLPAMATAEEFTCPQPAATPRVDVTIESHEPRLVDSQSREQLKSVKTSSASPYGEAPKIHTNGLMQGETTLETHLSFAWQKEGRHDYNCIWYQGAHITVRLNPVIYIAREIPKNTCLYNEVLQHEYKHLQVDRDILEKYRVLLQANLQGFLNQSHVEGPYRSDVVAAARSHMNATFDAQVEKIHRLLQEERLSRQQTIDSRSEYDRIGHACPQDAGII